jgi:hypothetical protein
LVLLSCRRLLRASTRVPRERLLGWHEVLPSS